MDDEQKQYFSKGFNTDQGLNFTPFLARTYPPHVYGRARLGSPTLNANSGPFQRFDSFNKTPHDSSSGSFARPLGSATRLPSNISPRALFCEGNKNALNQHLRSSSPHCIHHGNKNAACRPIEKSELNRPISYNQNDPRTGYDGHYEGDVNMFNAKKSSIEDVSSHNPRYSHGSPTRFVSKRNFHDNAKDTVFINDKSDASSLNNKKKPNIVGKFNNVYTFIKSPELRSQCKANHGNNISFALFLMFLNYLIMLCIAIYNYIAIAYSKICSLFMGIWRGKFFLRTATRRLLWWLTLAKFHDLGHFTIVACAAPWLFIIGIIGLFITLLCEVKNVLTAIKNKLTGR